MFTCYQRHASKQLSQWELVKKGWERGGNGWGQLSRENYLWSYPEGGGGNQGAILQRQLSKSTLHISKTKIVT